MQYHYADLFQYRNDLRALLTDLGLASQAEKISIIESSTNEHARIIRARDIRFSDNAVFHFTELVALQYSRIVSLRYSYHFQKGNYFFRYDKDASVNPFAHAEHHLHVSGAEHQPMRYITHETNLLQILSFILGNFDFKQ